LGYSVKLATIRLAGREDGMVTQGDAPNDGIEVPGRFLPFPRSISREARTNLAALAAQRAGTSPETETLPGDPAEWAVLVELVNAGIVAMQLASHGAPQATTETLDIDGLTIYQSTPVDLIAELSPFAFLDIHGGAFTYGGGEACRTWSAGWADILGVTCFSVDYRMPPQHPYPSPLDDCVAAYRWLLQQYGAPNIVVGGMSAGGNLAAAAMLRARDEGLALPAGLVLLTPEVDLTESGDSFETNKYADVVLVGSLAATIEMYAGGADLGDPYLSPLFGDMTKGFPRTYLQAGTRDLFLSNAVRMHRSLRRAGVSVELHIVEGAPHGGMLGELRAPEDAEMEAEMKRFARECWMSS
jgi:acetyl esterase/lipase